MKSLGVFLSLFLISITYATTSSITYANVSCIENSSQTQCNTNTQLILRIYNSYSGSIAWNPSGPFVSSGGFLRTKTQTVPAYISATDSTIYTSTGNIYTLTGQGSGFYQNAHNITLSLGDGIKSRSAGFLKNEKEPFESNTISVLLDQTPPSTPNQLGPDIHSLQTGVYIPLVWTPSVDTGIGLMKYRVWMSLDQNMGTGSSIIIELSGTSLNIPSSSLPLGTIYRRVEAVDYLGNSSMGPIIFFHNQAPSVRSSGASSSSSSSNGATNGSTIYIGSTTTNISATQDASTTAGITKVFQRLDQDMYEGKHKTIYETQTLYKKPRIGQKMLELFHESPTAQDRILPTKLPKTGVEAMDIYNNTHIDDYLTKKHPNYLTNNNIIYILLMSVLFVFLSFFFKQKGKNFLA